MILSDLPAPISRCTYLRGDIIFPVLRLINTFQEIQQNQDQEAITVTGKLNVFITFLIKFIIDLDFSSPVDRIVKKTVPVKARNCPPPMKNLKNGAGGKSRWIFHQLWSEILIDLGVWSIE